MVSTAVTIDSAVFEDVVCPHTLPSFASSLERNQKQVSESHAITPREKLLGLNNRNAGIIRKSYVTAVLR